MVPTIFTVVKAVDENLESCGKQSSLPRPLICTQIADVRRENSCLTTITTTRVLTLTIYSTSSSLSKF